MFLCTIKYYCAFIVLHNTKSSDEIEEKYFPIYVKTIHLTIVIHQRKMTFSGKKWYWFYLKKGKCPLFLSKSKIYTCRYHYNFNFSAVPNHYRCIFLQFSYLPFQWQKRFSRKRIWFVWEYSILIQIFWLNLFQWFRHDGFEFLHLYARRSFHSKFITKK